MMIDNSISSVLNRATLALVNSESPQLDARLLLSQVLEETQTYLMTWPERELDATQLQAFDILIAQRVEGHPIAHLIGVREFWSLDFLVSDVTLIPRPDTEVLVEQALAHSLTAKRILDLGTGTGAIAIALAHELPQVCVTAVDVQLDAVKLAQHNVARLKADNVSVKHGSWFDPVAGEYFDVIVSNPPYIDSQDPHLSLGDVRFEPTSALVASEGGMADLRRIIYCSPDYLNLSGWLLIEHGFEQGKAVRLLFSERGFSCVETCLDYGGQERVTYGCWR